MTKKTSKPRPERKRKVSAKAKKPPGLTSVTPRSLDG